MGDIGPERGRYEVLAADDLGIQGTEAAPPAGRVPDPEPMPVPGPEPVPDPSTPGPGPEPVPAPPSAG